MIPANMAPDGRTINATIIFSYDMAWKEAPSDSQSGLLVMSN